jgi:hypothetical protein
MTDIAALRALLDQLHTADTAALHAERRLRQFRLLRTPAFAAVVLISVAAHLTGNYPAGTIAGGGLGVVCIAVGWRRLSAAIRCRNILAGLDTDLESTVDTLARHLDHPDAGACVQLLHDHPATLTGLRSHHENRCVAALHLRRTSSWRGYPLAENPGTLVTYAALARHHPTLDTISGDPKVHSGSGCNHEQFRMVADRITRDLTALDPDVRDLANRLARDDSDNVATWEDLIGTAAALTSRTVT